MYGKDDTIDTCITGNASRETRDSASKSPQIAIYNITTCSAVLTKTSNDEGAITYVPSRNEVRERAVSQFVVAFRLRCSVM
jgi:hypothetical protein